MGEPETEEVDGMLVIVQKDIVHVDITDEQVQNIVNKVSELRSFVVK